MRTCTGCGIELNNKNTKHYRRINYIHKCNECDKKEKREQARKYYKNDPLKMRERSERYNSRLKESNPIRYTARQIAASSKKRANALGLDFDINTDYIESICTEKCPVFKKSLKYGGGDKTKWSASLDRIDPEKGYVKGNVVIVSSLANCMKSNATFEELREFAEWAIRFSGRLRN